MLMLVGMQIPDTDEELLHAFYPMLARKILEDMVAENEEGITELDPDYETLFKSSILARKSVLYYLLTRLQARDAVSVKQVIAKIDKAILADEPCFVQSLITQVLSTNVCQIPNDYCKA